MARVRIDLPDELDFSTDIDVHVGYVNYAGHLGNDSVLAIANEARMRFLKSLGYSETDVEGRGIVTADAGIVYKSEAFQGDVLKVEVGFMDLSGKGCDICFRICHRDTGHEVARVKTGIVFFDPATRRTVGIPERFLERFGTDCQQ